MQRTFEEVVSANLVTQKKAREDFARVRMLVVQRGNISNLQRIKYMSHGSNKNESKGISFNKFKVREPNQSKPPPETQKRRSLFVFGKVKTKTTLEDSDVSNVSNKMQKEESLSGCGNIKSKKTLEE